MRQHLAGVEVLKDPKARAMKGDHNRHDFTHTQTRTIGLGFAILWQLGQLIAGCFKGSVEVIDIAEDCRQIETR